MRFRQRCAALLLLAAAVMPQVVWAGAHALRHHEHEAQADGHPAEPSCLAPALVHGHEHTPDVPAHEHTFQAPAPLCQAPPPALQAASLAFVDLAADTGQVPPPRVRPWQESVRLSGCGPPRLHLLCTLLI